MTCQVFLQHSLYKKLCNAKRDAWKDSKWENRRIELLWNTPLRLELDNTEIVFWFTFYDIFQNWNIIILNFHFASSEFHA